MRYLASRGHFGKVFWVIVSFWMRWCLSNETWTVLVRNSVHRTTEQKKRLEANKFIQFLQTLYSSNNDDDDKKAWIKNFSCINLFNKNSSMFFLFKWDAMKFVVCKLFSIWFLFEASLLVVTHWFRIANFQTIPKICLC